MRDSTQITILLDRTGSMSTIKDETISGYNAFIKDQAAAGENATLTLVQFDRFTNDNICEVVEEATPIRSVKPLTTDTYQPRGNTPLLQAICETIESTGRTLDRIPEANRPDKVVFVIITDGEENASERSYTKDRVKQAITHQEQTYNWKFLFLGANMDAMNEARAMGVDIAMAAGFSGSGQSMGASMRANSANVRSYRVSGQSTALHYSTNQRKQMADEPDDAKTKKRPRPNSLKRDTK